MPTTHVIDVSVLEEGRTLRVAEAVPLVFAMDLATIDEPADLDVTIRRTAAGFEIKGSATVSLATRCHRCLIAVDAPLEVSIEDLATETPDDGQPTVVGDRIDVLPIARDAVGLAIPLRPLCQDECRGLCAVCGTDLNTDPCDGHDEVPQNPFAVLEHLLDPE